MKAIIVILYEDEEKERLNEIRLLCNTIGYDVTRIFSQKGRPNRKYLVREGKVEEIKDSIHGTDVEIVIFENFLTSRQVLSLEDEFGVPVIDRFDLILNVFERHARSKEAKLQIELARLKRKLPYIKMFLSRKVKAEHPGFGGSGEFIVHSTLTTLHRRIKSLEKSLEKFENRADLQRRRRKSVGKVVSLAGYTNVGKTSLLFALTGVKKASKNELFTTLRTKTSSFKIDGQKVMLSDTIGFIRNLPHQLIYAFKSTLGDISNSDLVLIVHDSSLDEKEFLRRKEICENTLSQIGAGEINWLNIESKIDIGKKRLQNSIAVSSLTLEGIEELKSSIKREIEDGK
jgi:GTP-binding protein HflX